MIIAKVVGNVVATKKNEGLVGAKLLVVKPVNEKDEDGNLKEEEKFLVAVDSVGAGIGEMVLLVTGSTATKIMNDANAPVDAAVVGIIDEIEIH
ncbi:ethanolamine utilization protein EutN [Caldanaerovirga acetigignens]|uniref:Ethanolamine utilization protein EutN n=1 Tax=Caldanaerovirga acetigignens TaxID=447595 RepID=A0A1M7MC87_9FIRM|nr:EutN/CcmL family microcompartment protein [Caldanaerovirga acetigignens]SHM88384.1 ethanolamine utilization protein EutN [Caldanaerovirga acetigignens]